MKLFCLSSFFLRLFMKPCINLQDLHRLPLDVCKSDTSRPSLSFINTEPSSSPPPAPIKHYIVYSCILIPCRSVPGDALTTSSRSAVDSLNTVQWALCWAGHMPWCLVKSSSWFTLAHPTVSLRTAQKKGFASQNWVQISYCRGYFSSQSLFLKSVCFSVSIPAG